MNKKYVKIAAFITLPLSLIIMLLSLAPTVIEYMAIKGWLPENNFRVFPWAEHFIGLSEADKKQMMVDYHAWKEQKIHLPPAALDPKPFSPGLIAAAHALDQAWEKQGVQARASLIPYQVDKYTHEIIDSKKINFKTLSIDLAQLTPLISAFETLASCPVYEISALCSAQLHTCGGFPFITDQYLCCASWLELKILALAHEQKQAEALAYAALLVRSSHVSPFDTEHDQVFAIIACSGAAEAWLTVVQQCSDPVLLRQTLEKQNQLAPQIAFFLDESIPIEALNSIGELRELKRRGMACSYQDLTIRQLDVLSLETRMKYLETKVLPLVKNNPTTSSQVISSIEQYHHFALFWGGQANNPQEWLKREYYTMFGPMYYLDIHSPLRYANFYRLRSRACRTQFDLLRLETASKLYRLEHGQAPASAAALVPQYLPELPADPFSADKKAPICQAGDVFYSLGPDGRDDKAKFLYDPTNGTASLGDLVLRPIN